MHNKSFCLIWKSQNISFNQTIKDELKPNFKGVDNVIYDEQVNVFFQYENKPKKLESPITKVIVYDLETFNKIRFVPYCSCIFKLNEFQVKIIEINP